MGMGFKAHLTMMYTGDLSPQMESQVQSVLEGLGNPAFYVERIGFDMFGPDNDIPVLRVKPTQAMRGLRNFFENNHMIPNPSEFDWNPHITLKFEFGSTLKIPPLITLHRLGLY